MKRSPGYQACVRALAEDLTRRASSGPGLRVAIDGRSGAGKSTFSHALVKALSDMGRPAVRVQIDDFHHPRIKRYARGRHSAEGYYRDARDLKALKHMCLIPLGPGGTGRFAAASFDLETDRPLEPHWRQAEPAQIVVVEGTFLLRPELDACWDVRIHLQVSKEIARSRGTARDQELLGDEAEALYRQRYEGAYALYEAESSIAIANADWQVDLTSFDAPRLMKADAC
jgi:uridine kinase